MEIKRETMITALDEAISAMRDKLEMLVEIRRHVAAGGDLASPPSSPPLPKAPPARPGGAAPAKGAARARAARSEPEDLCDMRQDGLCSGTVAVADCGGACGTAACTFRVCRCHGHGGDLAGKSAITAHRSRVRVADSPR